jgi:hypothetical protein
MTERTAKAPHQTGRLRRRNRAAIVAVIAWLLLAHTLFAVHRIDHFTADGVTCAMCVAAHHAGGPIQEPLHAIAMPEPAAVASSSKESAPVLLILSYYSRGPPLHLRS